MKQKLWIAPVLVLLSVLLCCAPAAASSSGDCGDNLTWELSGGKLTISGTGPMWDYSEEYSGWYDDRDQISAIVIEDGVTSIGECAFYYMPTMTDVRIPKSVTSIGERAFEASGLTSADLPNGITEIGDKVFYGCYDLTYAKIPESVATIGSFAFSRCGLTSVSIPDGVTTIKDYAFSYCESLTKADFPDTVTAIGNGVFMESGLTSATIRNFKAEFGFDVFDGCPASLVIYGWEGSTAAAYAQANDIDFRAWATAGACGEEVNWSLNLTTGKMTISGTGPMWDCDVENPGWIDAKDLITEVEIKNGVTSIGINAFSNCPNLKKATIPGSVKEIGVSAFYKCTALEALIIPYGVTDIQDSAFERCANIKGSLTIPDSVTSIGESAFSACSGLTDLTLSKNLTTIGDLVFYNCRNLANVTIPDGMTSIAYGMFWASGLTSITIPESVTYIGQYAFCNCYLTNVVIPANVKTIDEGAFNYCSDLKSVTFYNPDVKIDPMGVFEHHAYVPFDLVIRGWPDSTAESYASKFEIPFQALSVPEPTFFLPSSLTKIDADAFAKIKAKAVVVPKKVTAINGNPFSGSSVQAIYGYDGSAAKTFAQTYGYYFVTIDDAWMAGHRP